MLHPVLQKISKVHGDGAYDSRKNFQYLNNSGVQAVIPFRSNSSFLFRGKGSARGRVVRLINKIGLDEWKKEVHYSKRWRFEAFFSSLKRVVGEVIMAKKMMYHIQEEVMKICIHISCSGRILR